MSLLFVWRSWKGDTLFSVTEVTIEPTNKAMNNAIKLDIQFELTVEIKFSHGYCFKVNIIEFVSISQNVLMFNGVNNRLTEDPFLHAFHANSIDVVPKTLR
jgi:hypothetical protein